MELGCNNENFDNKKIRHWIDFILDKLNVNVVNAADYEDIKKCISPLTNDHKDILELLVPLIESIKERKIDIGDVTVPSGFFCQRINKIFNYINTYGFYRNLATLVNIFDKVVLYKPIENKKNTMIYKDLDGSIKLLSKIINTELNENQISSCFDNWLRENNKYQVSMERSELENINIQEKQLYISFFTKILSKHHQNKKRDDDLKTRFDRLNDRLNGGSRTRKQKRTRSKHKKKYTRRNKRI